jgi:hypothetical protein
LGMSWSICEYHAWAGSASKPNEAAAASIHRSSFSPLSVAIVSEATGAFPVGEARPLIRASRSASQACGSTSLRRAVWINVYITAARSPPLATALLPIPSVPRDFRLQTCGGRS